MNVWYYGLADCNGVESFVPDIDGAIADLFMQDGTTENIKTDQFRLAMRAHANQQRHAVVYRVLIPLEEVKHIEEDLANGEYVEALNRIKKSAVEVNLGVLATTLKAAEKNWSMIPNPDLDPHHTR